jgi:NADPH:quinone reductase-like Zn-dependent oxidoreductase
MAVGEGGSQQLLARSGVHVVLPRIARPEELVIEAAAVAPPPEGHVLLRMEATGVSFAEQQMRLGRYYDQPSFPFVPGYDVVGIVIAVGVSVSPDFVGRRFAAVTKTGSWAEFVTVDARALLEVPSDLDPAEIETVIVNGITAWRMLHETANVRTGGTVVVLGANGGVGSVLIQLARDHGIRVIGTAAPRHHDFVSSLGAEPLDYNDPALYGRIRELAPDGVDAVFDHVGGKGLARSWSLLRRGGTLVSYGTAEAKDGRGSARLPFVTLFTRLTVWNILPNGRRARFFNFWDGLRAPDRFYAVQREAFARVIALVRSGVLRPQVAARVPLSDAVRALELAESRTVAGKVVIIPDGIEPLP